MRPAALLLASCVAAWALAGLAAAPAGERAQTATAAPRAAADAARRFVGSWRLAAFTSSDPDSMKFRGANPIGVLFYDDSGHMSVQIAPDRARKRFSGPVAELFSGPRPTPDEAYDAIAGYAAYFGTYVVDEQAQTVTHKRIANVNPGGLGDFVRRYEFATNDRLVLVPLERSDRRAITLTWERQR